MTSTNPNELSFVNNGDPEDKEWAAHIHLLNEWTDPDYVLRHIIQTARAGEFRPADMHVDLIKQWHLNIINQEKAKLVNVLEKELDAAKSNLKFQEEQTKNPRLVREWKGTVFGIELCLNSIKREMK